MLRRDGDGGGGGGVRGGGASHDGQAKVPSGQQMTSLIS